MSNDGGSKGDERPEPLPFVEVVRLASCLLKCSVCKPYNYSKSRSVEQEQVSELSLAPDAVGFAPLGAPSEGSDYRCGNKCKSEGKPVPVFYGHRPQQRAEGQNEPHEPIIGEEGFKVFHNPHFQSEIRQKYD